VGSVGIVDRQSAIVHRRAFMVELAAGARN